MPRHSYHERDSAFGQIMLELRSSIGLTQASMANLLRVSRHAVGEREGGSLQRCAPSCSERLMCTSVGGRVE